MIQYYSSVTSLSRLIVVVLILSGCGTNRSPKTFKLLSSKDSGIDFINELEDTPRQNIIEYLYYYNGGGVAIGDVNNDDLLDIYFTSNQDVNRLYINQGELRFKESTGSFGLPIQADTTKWSTGVVMVDINGDGFPDIYECVVGDYKSFTGKNKLYINQGGAAFKESAAEYGLDFSGFSTQSAFLDYDRDGDLDMYLLNHSVHGTDTYGETKLRKKKDEKAGDRFFENRLSEGAGFVDVTDSVGIYSSRLGYGLGIAISDLNNDGLSDIYIGNDFHEDDYIYLNNGDKTFREVGRELLGHSSQFTMGLDVADLNLDGRMDIFSLDMLPSDATVLLKSGGDDSNFIKDIKKKNGYGPQYSRNAFQINYGNHFKELGLYHDVYATDWSWSVLIQDYDNDLDNDLFITNGIYKRPNDLDYINFLSNAIQQKSSTEELIAKMPSDKINNVFFENEGQLHFKNNTEEFGLSLIGYSNGASYGDLDNDGDLDLVVNNLNQESSVFENLSGSLTNFLNVSLSDSTSLNREGYGATVTVYTDSLAISKEVNTTRGFQSSVSSRMHFGLGQLVEVDSIKVVWADGVTQVFGNTGANQFLTIEKGPESQKELSSSARVTMDRITYLDFQHKEDDYLDYQNEKLLPWALSKEGPAVAVADLNRDGVNDFYIGGAHFQPGALYLSKGDSTFEAIPQGHFDRDAGYEDVAAQFLDVNRDGFLDLMVASGGARFPDGHPLLEDRIYFNDGTNQFRRWVTPLPKINSSSIAYQEIEGKGHLFVGASSVFGSYGKTPKSYMMKWNNSRFDPIQFYEFGLVSDAVWSEVDGDNGLLVVGDWMPISFYQLESDSLVDQELPLFSKTNGLWNSITAGDINGDGIEDYFFSNAGMNSKWKPTASDPVIMNLADFDENGQVEPIIFTSYFGESIPLNTRMDLVKQVPAINKQNNTNLKFSGVREVGDLIESVKPDELYVFETRSRLLLSQQSGYKWESLPREFQYGAIQDAAFLDDQIYYVGNDFTLYSILGRSDSNPAGIGLVGQEVEWSMLPVPSNLDYRKIEKLAETKFLILPNSASPFVFDID